MRYWLNSLLLALSLVSFLSHSKAKPSTDADGAASLELAKLHGWVMFNKLEVQQYYSTEELRAFVAGIEMAANNEIPAKAKALYPKLEGFIHEKMRVMADRNRLANKLLYEKNQKIANDFVIQLKKGDDSLRESQSGLLYRILSQGAGKAAKVEDNVEVKISVRLISGEQVNKYDGSKVISMPVGSQRIGVTESLTLLNEGGEGIFYLPANLVQGSSWNGDVPPGSMVIYKIELIKVL